jgi:ParB family chromosome partitioning protein
MGKGKETAFPAIRQAGVLQPRGPILELDAAAIVTGRWENRLPEAYEAPEFGELKRAIAHTGGNTQPITVRGLASATLSSPKAQQYELVTGHRRMRACKELGLPVRAMVLPALRDQDLFMFVYHENSSREPLRPYELGRMCARALEAGTYPSLRNMCFSADLDLASASRAIRVYEFPKTLHELIRSPMQWHLKDAERLAKIIYDEGFPKKVEELKRIHGVMDRAPLLRALAGVGSANDETVLEIVENGDVLGRIHLGHEGNVRIVLLPVFTREHADDLRAMMQLWFARWRRDEHP